MQRLLNRVHTSNREGRLSAGHSLSHRIILLAILTFTVMATAQAEPLDFSFADPVGDYTGTGMTLPAEQWSMNQQLYRLLFASVPNAQPMTLGEAMLRAKASVSSIDIRRTWILFGDPTTRMR